MSLFFDDDLVLNNKADFIPNSRCLDKHVRFNNPFGADAVVAMAFSPPTVVNRSSETSRVGVVSGSEALPRLFPFGNRKEQYDNHFTLYKNRTRREMLLVIAPLTERLSCDLSSKLYYLRWTVPENGVVYSDRGGGWMITVDRLSDFSQTHVDYRHMADHFAFVAYGEWWYLDRGIVLNAIANPAVQNGVHVFSDRNVKAFAPFATTRSSPHLLYLEFFQTETRLPNGSLTKKDCSTLVPNDKFLDRVVVNAGRGNLSDMLPLAM